MSKIITRSVHLADIRIDGGTQTRIALDTETVSEYAEQMDAGTKFPAVIVFHDGSDYWMADGFHRFHASRQCGYVDILAEVHTGTRIDALKCALGANRANGLQRTNADKRKCVEIALKEFGDMSDRGIAELCGVSNEFVGKVRPQVSFVDTSAKPTHRTGKDGKSYPVKASKPTVKESLPVQSEPQAKPEPIPVPRSVPLPPSDGLQYAAMAIIDLEKIQPDDSQRIAAFEKVTRWINANK